MTQTPLTVPGLMLSLVLVTLSISSSMVAQGPVYRERWGYLHLENRRAEVFDALRGRSAEDVAKVSALLVAADQGVPFRPVANALASLRGVAADDAFLVRTALSMYVLPEVVDPNATTETCRCANFSVFLPFTIDVPGALSFEVTVRNSKDEQVWSQLIERNCGVRDLRMARATASMKDVDLPDGTYQVQLRSLLDGQPPREYDPQLRWTFHVERGYQRRADVAMATALTLRDELPLVARAQLDGLAAQVSRAYTGEAFAVRSDAVRELQLFETALANLETKQPVLARIKGEVVTALPAGERSSLGSESPTTQLPTTQGIVQPCILRMPKDSAPHAMVVFATGSPTYDVGSHRPTAPTMREASWLLRELAGFGVTEQWHVVGLDSPGGGRPYLQALLATLEALPQVLPTGGKKPLLVCDREAAAIVGMQLAKIRPHVSGVVLVGGGAMPKSVIDSLGDLPVRYVLLSGYPGSRAVDRTLQYLAAREANGESKRDVALLHTRQEPWLFGVSRSLPELRSFAARVFADR